MTNIEIGGNCTDLQKLKLQDSLRERFSNKNHADSFAKYCFAKLLRLVDSSDFDDLHMVMHGTFEFV